MQMAMRRLDSSAPIRVPSQRGGKTDMSHLPAGLYANGIVVPLKGVAIEVTAAGPASRVVVAQRYKNLEKKPIEAVYSFPLDEGSAVCAFEVLIGDKRVVGKV